MKIAIDGTHSSGKTTLLEVLKKEAFYNLRYFSESGSIIANTSFNVKDPKDWEELFINKQKYIAFFNELIKYQLEIEKQFNNFCIDSSIYRAYAYGIVNKIDLDFTILKQLEYDIIFLCSNELHFIENNFRFDFNKNEIYETLFELLQKYYKGNLIILKGSVDDRIENIKKTILKCS